MKKFLCLFLSVLMLLTIVSCGDQTDDPSAKTEQNGTNASGDNSQEPVVTTSKYLDNLPEKMDFGGETINIVSMDRDWWVDEVTPSDDDGTVINNAVAQRNSIIEDRLNIKINNTKLQATNYSVIIDAIDKDYRDGAGLYDISYCNGYKAAMDMSSGHFLDLNKIGGIDLTQEYWMQGLNEQLSYKGAQFIASGDISISTVRMAFATIFNKKMFDSNHIPYLYETVNKNEWTLEYQLKLLDTFYKPVSADGPTDEDTFAFASSQLVVSDGYWEACDLSILRKNAKGEYEHSTDADRYSAVVDGVIALFKHKGTKIYDHKDDDGEFADISKFFADGKAAMGTIILVECEREWTRNMTDAYGLVPLPKLNKDQQNHHTHLFDQYTVVSVLRGTDKENLEMLGSFLEAMASESSRITMPAYYELTLKQKYQSDPTSWEMLDTIMNGVVCDAGNLFFSLIDKPHMKLGQIIKSGQNTVASTMTTYKRTMPVYLKKLNEDLTAAAANGTK